MDCGHDRWAHDIAYRERQNTLTATQLEFSRLAASLLKCNVPAIGPTTRKQHTLFRPFFRTCVGVYEKERAALAVYIR